MGTWKKVFTSADTIPLGNGGTNNTETTKGFTLNDGSKIDSVAGNSGDLLIGQGSSAKPAPKAVSGVITIDNNGVTAFSGTPVGTSAIDNNAVTFAKMQNLTAGDLIRGLDSGEPGALAIGTNGHVLTVDTNVDGKLKFAAAPPAANTTIADGSSDTAAKPVLFGSAVGTTETVRADASNLTYEPDVTFSHKTGADLSTAGAGSFVSVNGFSGDLHGTASAAELTKTTVSNVSGANYSLLMASSSINNDEYSKHTADSNLTWDGAKLKITGNLEVVGDVTQTSVSVVNTEIQDALIKVAGGSTDSAAAQTAGADGVGIAVDNGTAADANLARFVYKGVSDGASVLGWNISQEADNAASAAANLFGVGVMKVVTTEFTTSSTDAIGIGAMLYSSNATNGGLFIQTA